MALETHRHARGRRGRSAIFQRTFVKPVGGTIPASLGGGKMSHVLIVDDSEDIRLALRTILEDAEYEVKELSDGTEVLWALQTDPPDLVLLDVAMPVKNGFDTLKEIIADEQIRDIPVIMVTAKGRTEDLSRARALGARDYINKPWEDGEVELRVGWVMRAQELRAAS